MLVPLAAAADRPNVLFIAIDDLNDWVNCMGGRSGVHTPHLGLIGQARGLVYQRALRSAGV